MGRTGVVARDEVAVDDPGPQQHLAVEELGSAGGDVEDTDLLHGRVELPLDDEGLVLLATLLEPPPPVLLATRVAHEDAVGASGLVVGAGDLEHEVLSRTERRVEQLLEGVEAELRHVGVTRLEDHGELILGEADHVRLRHDGLQQLEVPRGQQLAEGILLHPEEAEPALGAEVRELGEHAHSTALGSQDELGERSRGLEDRELPPDRADLLAVEQDAVLLDLQAIQLGRGGEAGRVATLTQVLGEPAHGRDVGFAPVVGDDEEDGALLEEEVVARLPGLLVDPVGVVQVDQIAEAAGHLVVLAGHQVITVDVHVRPTDGPVIHDPFPAAREQVAVAQLGDGGVHHHTRHQDVLQVRAGGQQRGARALEGSDGPHRSLHDGARELGRSPGEALPGEADALRDLGGVLGIQDGAHVRAIVEALDQLGEHVRGHQHGRGVLATTGRTPGELADSHILAEVALEAPAELLGAVADRTVGGDVGVARDALTDDHAPVGALGPGGHARVLPTAGVHAELVAGATVVDRHRPLGTVSVGEGLGDLLRAIEDADVDPLPSVEGNQGVTITLGQEGLQDGNGTGVVVTRAVDREHEGGRRALLATHIGPEETLAVSHFNLVELVLVGAPLYKGPGRDSRPECWYIPDIQITST